MINYPYTTIHVLQFCDFMFQKFPNWNIRHVWPITCYMDVQFISSFA